MISLKNLENTIRNKARSIGSTPVTNKKVLTGLQDTGYAVNELLQGTPFGNKIAKKLDVRLPSKPATDVGRGMGYVGRLAPTFGLTAGLGAVAKGSRLVKPAQKILGSQAGKIISRGTPLSKVAGRGVANLSQGLPYTLGYQAYNQLQKAGGEDTPNSAKEFGTDLAFDFATGSLPVIGVAGTIAGKTAKSFIGKQGDDLAQEILKKGAYSDVKDKGLRFFISDNYAKLNRKVFNKLTKTIDATGQPAETTLGEFLKHDELYKEYPQAKNLKVIFNPAIDARGQFDPSNGSIILNPKSGNWMEKLGILLHENQHYLQEVENFSRGSNPAIEKQMALSKLRDLENVRTSYNKLRGELQDLASMGKDDPAKRKLLIDTNNYLIGMGVNIHNRDTLQAFISGDFGKIAQDIGDNSMSSYRKTAGEIEARAVQNPNNIRLPAKDLKGKDILSEQMKLEGIEPDEVIVRGSNGVNASADNSLIQEARKYKSAEEFVKAQRSGKDIVFHQTNAKNADNIYKEGFKTGEELQVGEVTNAVYFTGNNRSQGANYVRGAGKGTKIPVDISKLKLVDITDFPLKEQIKYVQDAKRGLFPRGRDGVIQRNKNGSIFEVALRKDVATNNIVKTKSQLTDIWNQANNVMADVGGKERGFITTLKDSPKTDPRVAGELEGAYIPQTNKATLKTAKDNLKNDFTGAIRRAVDLNESLTPESVAEGHLLIDMLSRKGDIEGAVSVAEALAEKGTKQGQIVQAFSMWDRLTPEGMLTYAQRAVNKANEGRGAIDNILGRDNIKLSPEDAQEILKTMQDAQKVPVSERGAYTKKALEVINKAIPPSASELFDAYRYEGMLSNPRTQLRNIHGNLLQTFVTKPMAMAFETPFDWMQSTLFGAERKRYLSDVPEYYRDVVNSIPLGAEAFMKSMKGSLPVDKPDLESVRKISGPVSRFMEGMDKFNQTIIGGAIKNDLMSKGMSEGEALEQAQKQAEYWLFRQKADPKNLTGQGYLLSAVDKLSSSISDLPGRKWFIPFIQTPTNVAKQFLEFSPAGLATIPGNKNPVEQLAKTSAGTVAMLIGAKLAAEGRLSWAAPTSPEDKAIFYETRKPFSVKVGDTWVPMQYFGPFALALALPAAYEYYDKVEKKSLTSTQAQKAYNTVLNSFQFMTNQTFLTGLNNYVQVLSGDPDYSFPSSAGFTATQAVPYSGLLRYISTIVDPTMRKSKRFMDSFYTTIPGMSDKAFPYLDPMGQPVQRDPINYITPYDIKESDPAYERIYQSNVRTSQSDDIRNFSSRIRAIGRDPTLSIEEKRSKILAEERKMKTARENINKLEGSR